MRRSKPRMRTDADMRDFSACGPRLDRSTRDHFGAVASFCLRQNRPRGAISIRLSAASTDASLSVGVHRITDAMRRTFADLEDASEVGAYGVALLLAATQMGLRFARRSYKGT